MSVTKTDDITNHWHDCSWTGVTLNQMPPLRRTSTGTPQFPGKFNRLVGLWTARKDLTPIDIIIIIIVKVIIINHNINRTLRTLWLVKNRCFIRVYIKHRGKSVFYCFSLFAACRIYIIKQMKRAKPCIIRLWWNTSCIW